MKQKIKDKMGNLKYPTTSEFDKSVFCPACGVEYSPNLTEKMEWVGECHGRPMYEIFVICPHCDERILIK